VYLHFAYHNYDPKALEVIITKQLTTSILHTHCQATCNTTHT